jgi:hypothetical protein
MIVCFFLIYLAVLEVCLDEAELGSLYNLKASYEEPKSTS